MPLTSVSQGLELIQRRLGAEARVVFRDGSSVIEIERERFEETESRIARHLFALSYDDAAKALIAFDSSSKLFSFYLFQDGMMWNNHDGALQGPFNGQFEIVKAGMGEMAGRLVERVTVRN